jgi:hypothetical protein
LNSNNKIFASFENVSEGNIDIMIFLPSQNKWFSWRHVILKHVCQQISLNEHMRCYQNISRHVFSIIPYCLFPDTLNPLPLLETCKPHSELFRWALRFFCDTILLPLLIEYELTSEKNKSLRELDPECEYK